MNNQKKTWKRKKNEKKEYIEKYLSHKMFKIEKRLERIIIKAAKQGGSEINIRNLLPFSIRLRNYFKNIENEYEIMIAKHLENNGYEVKYKGFYSIYDKENYPGFFVKNVTCEDFWRIK